MKYRKFGSSERLDETQRAFIQECYKSGAPSWIFMVVATGDQSMVYLWAHNIANILTVAFNHIFTCLFIIFRKIIQTKSIIWLSTERQATSCPHKSGPGCRLKPACTHFGSRIPSTEQVWSLLLHFYCIYFSGRINATLHLTVYFSIANLKSRVIVLGRKNIKKF